jgi:predicted Fe-S protein YdhL (DUF1289 family)
MPADELGRLIRQQIRDDRNRLDPRRREVRECDLTPRHSPRGNLDRFAVEERPPAVLIGFTATWTAQVIGYDPARPGECPGCGDHRLRPHESCVVCSRTARVPRRWPMMDPMERAKILRLLIEVARVTRRKRRAATRAPSGQSH